MKLKKSKLVCGMMLGVMLLTGAMGCGGSTSENIFTYEDESTQAPVSETVMARVESVDNTSISLSVGGGRGGKDGKMPEDGEMPEGMTPPEDGEMPEGTEMPEGDERPQGNAAVLTVGDESVIRLMSMESGNTDNQESAEAAAEQGSLQDISEGSMLRITFDEDGKITDITVSEGMERPENKE